MQKSSFSYYYNVKKLQLLQNQDQNGFSKTKKSSTIAGRGFPNYLKNLSSLQNGYLKFVRYCSIEPHKLQKSNRLHQ